VFYTRYFFCFLILWYFYVWGFWLYLCSYEAGVLCKCWLQWVRFILMMCFMFCANMLLKTDERAILCVCMCACIYAVVLVSFPGVKQLECALHLSGAPSATNEPLLCLYDMYGMTFHYGACLLNNYIDFKKLLCERL